MAGNAQSKGYIPPVNPQENIPPADPSMNTQVSSPKPFVLLEDKEIGDEYSDQHIISCIESMKMAGDKSDISISYLNCPVMSFFGMDTNTTKRSFKHGFEQRSID